MKEAGLEEETKIPIPISQGSKSLSTVASEMGKAVIQRYMTNPLLFKGKKFDFRSYMFISCMNPFIVHFNPGYVRVSLEDFTMDNFSDNTVLSKATHLTNNSIQKKHPAYIPKKEETIITLQALADELKTIGKIESTEAFLEKVEKDMKEVMRLIFTTAKEFLIVKFGCFELLGFDFMIDEELNLKLIEINVNPALFTDTSVQQNLLPELIDQTVAIALKLHSDQTEKASPESIEEIQKFDKYELLYLDQ